MELHHSTVSSDLSKCQLISAQPLSEEHGWVTIPPDDPVRIGDRVEVIPNHICPSVNLFDEMTLVRGDTVVGQWEVAARGKKQ